MTLNWIVLQAAPAAGGSSWVSLAFPVLIFVVMYFMLIRPQQQRAKKEKQFRETLKKGDKVITIGGLHGVIKEIDEKTVLLEADSVKLRFDKAAIRELANPEQSQQS